MGEPSTTASVSEWADFFFTFGVLTPADWNAMDAEQRQAALGGAANAITTRAALAELARRSPGAFLPSMGPRRGGISPTPRGSSGAPVAEDEWERTVAAEAENYAERLEKQELLEQAADSIAQRMSPGGG